MSATVRQLTPGQAPGADLLRLNLGCGRNAMPGWVNVDRVPLPGVDLVADLEFCRYKKFAIVDDSVDQFMLSHALEHIHDTLGLMQELHRIAKPGATIQIRVPYGSSDDADEDPTHVRRYFLNSWLYFSQPAYWRADYGYRGDWQPETIELVVSLGRFQGLSREDALRKVHTERNAVREMIATLRAVKPIREPRRELQVPPEIKFVVLP